MNKSKEVFYVPVTTDEPCLVVQEYQRDYVLDLVRKREGYVFTAEELNDYTTNVIKRALDAAAEEAFPEFEFKRLANDNGVNRRSILGTFMNVFNQFKV